MLQDEPDQRPEVMILLRDFLANDEVEALIGAEVAARGVEVARVAIEAGPLPPPAEMEEKKAAGDGDEEEEDDDEEEEEAEGEGDAEGEATKGDGETKSRSSFSR